MANEHPIIFSGEMVRAIFDGRKTQTRRIIKPQPIFREYLQQDAFRFRGFGYIGIESLLAVAEHCPYGKVGDRLWVREARCENEWGIFYKADGSLDFQEAGVGAKWTPARFMKKIYARLWLEITGIRVERVQEITEEGCLAEGMLIEGTDLGNGTNTDNPYEQFAQLWDSINKKRKYIEGDMGKFPADFTPYSWDKNPWVWVIDFKQKEKEDADK